MRITVFLLAGVLAVPSFSAAQTIPRKIFATPDAEWSEPFSQLNGVRELRNGRVIVSDSRDKTVQLIDFKGAATRIGREGGGPGEYGLPLGLYAAPGDSTWLYDALNARFLVIDPSGKPVSTFTTVDASAAQPPTASTPPRGAPSASGGAVINRGAFGFGPPQGVDAQGRLYFRAPAVRFSGSGPSIGDSTPIVRWDRRRKSGDTVGFLVNPPTTVTSTGSPSSAGGQRVTVRMAGASTPFASSDVVVVTQPGAVAIVRAKDYHIDWLANGKSFSGAPIRFDRVKVTDEDKRQYVESRKNSTATMVMNDGSGARVQNMPAADLLGGNAPAFPEFKGPYRTAVAGPNQQVWVEVYMPAGTPPTYDVIDASGKVTSRMVFPKRTRLIGFGNGTVYVVRMDEDDLQYLQRYRL